MRGQMTLTHLSDACSFACGDVAFPWQRSRNDGDQSAWFTHRATARLLYAIMPQTPCETDERIPLIRTLVTTDDPAGVLDTDFCRLLLCQARTARTRLLDTVRCRRQGRTSLPHAFGDALNAASTLFHALMAAMYYRPNSAWYFFYETVLLAGALTRSAFYDRPQYLEITHMRLPALFDTPELVYGALFDLVQCTFLRDGCLPDEPGIWEGYPPSFVNLWPYVKTSGDRFRRVQLFIDGSYADMKHKLTPPVAEIFTSMPDLIPCLLDLIVNRLPDRYWCDGPSVPRPVKDAFSLALTVLALSPGCPEELLHAIAASRSSRKARCIARLRLKDTSPRQLEAVYNAMDWKSPLAPMLLGAILVHPNCSDDFKRNLTLIATLEFGLPGSSCWNNRLARHIMRVLATGQPAA